MDVYLIRHAEAYPLGEQGAETDEERPLTPEGEGQARKVGQVFRKLNVLLDAVVTTPLVRARRTAELLLEELPAPYPELVVADKLAPGCKPRRLGKFLRELNRPSVAVVGHQPDLTAWTGWLIGAKDATIDFAKGGVAYVEYDSEVSKGEGVLVWLITPAWYPVVTEATPAPGPTGVFPAQDDFAQRG